MGIPAAGLANAGTKAEIRIEAVLRLRKSSETIGNALCRFWANPNYLRERECRIWVPSAHRHPISYIVRAKP